MISMITKYVQIPYETRGKGIAGRDGFQVSGAAWTSAPMICRRSDPWFCTAEWSPRACFKSFNKQNIVYIVISCSLRVFFCIPNHCWYCWEILLTLSKVFGFHFFRYSNHSKHGKHMKVMPWSWSAITRGIRGLTRYSMAHLVHCSEQEPLMIFMVWNDADEISDKEMRSARCTYSISNPRTVKLPHGHILLKQYWGILGRGNT